jgi:NADP-dependent alcohol dehydrogenase
MKWHKTKNIKQYERFAKEIFNEDDADKGIELLEAWFAKIGAPVTLKDANIPRDGIKDLAINASSTAVMWGIGEQYSVDTIVEILEKA